MRRCLSARGSWRLYEMRAHLGDVVAVAVYGAPVTTLSSGGFRAVRSWGCRTASGRAEPINQLISTARSSRRIPGASKRTFIAPPAALAAGCESRFSARQMRTRRIQTPQRRGNLASRDAVFGELATDRVRSGQPAGLARPHGQT